MNAAESLNRDCKAFVDTGTVASSVSSAKISVHATLASTHSCRSNPHSALLLWSYLSPLAQAGSRCCDIDGEGLRLHRHQRSCKQQPECLQRDRHRKQSKLLVTLFAYKFCLSPLCQFEQLQLRVSAQLLQQLMVHVIMDSQHLGDASGLVKSSRDTAPRFWPSKCSSERAPRHGR